jgi:hypothetical protein
VIDISLLYIKRGQALLFRDGQKYNIYWTTASEEYEKTTGKLRPIRFIDAEGNPFPLKPGQTWIEIVPFYTPYWETVDSEIYNRLVYGDQPGSGYWAVRVHAPNKTKKVCFSSADLLDSKKSLSLQGAQSSSTTSPCRLLYWGGIP